MTHPDTLTIPRAVVEQALNAMLGVVYGDPVFGDQAKSAITSLRASLQPQAANKAGEKHAFNDESPFCVKCGSTGECADEIHRLTELLAWAYSKLHDRTFNKLEDNLKLDEMKLFLEHGL